jgi:hypothetical protein
MHYWGINLDINIFRISRAGSIRYQDFLDILANFSKILYMIRGRFFIDLRQLKTVIIVGQIVSIIQ